MTPPRQVYMKPPRIGRRFHQLAKVSRLISKATESLKWVAKPAKNHPSVLGVELRLRRCAVVWPPRHTRRYPAFGESVSKRVQTYEWHDPGMHGFKGDRPRSGDFVNRLRGSLECQLSSHEPKGRHMRDTYVCFLGRNLYKVRPRPRRLAPLH